MFRFWRRDPLKKLQADYEALLAKARDLQRRGDIRGYAEVSAKAEELARRIEELTRKP